jgi:predicted secreted acid phosphatase
MVFAPPSLYLQPRVATRFAASAQGQRLARIDSHLNATETPAFRQSFQAVINNARTCVERHLQAGRRGIVILDIDETILDNRGYFRDPQQQFYKRGTGLAAIKETWEAWVQKASTPVIPETLAFINWLNTRQVPYCFLTGISETLREPSKRNLVNVGALGPQCLGTFYKPDTEPSTRKFKEKMRQNIEQAFSLPILASLGDRPGDMTGDPQKDFLLPGYVKALRAENDLG